MGICYHFLDNIKGYCFHPKPLSQYFHQSTTGLVTTLHLLLL